MSIEKYSYKNYKPNNPQENPRKRAPYIRILELQAVISEEWGETIKELNNYIWKGFKPEELAKAYDELNQMYSPMAELKGLIEAEMIKHEQAAQENNEGETE